MRPCTKGVRDMLASVDKHMGLPVYIQIMNMIKKEVMLGNLIDGEQLPPVRELSKIFDVNTNTVMRALEKLSMQEIVEAKHGIGYFIRYATAVDSKVIEDMKCFIRELKKKGMDLPMTKLLVEELWKNA